MRECRNDLTAGYVRSILDYNSETGIFTWKYRESHPVRWNSRFAGMPAGGIRPIIKYHCIGIDHKLYYSHRLAWLIVTGEWPKDQLDHIDLDRANNKFSNLRESTQSQNMHNLPKRKDNTSGHKGVSWHSKVGAWCARIVIEGEKIHLGSFSNLEDAAKSYRIAAEKYHKEFANVG